MPIRSAPTSIILEPPLAVVEILSPEDRFGAVVRKCADYEGFGIPEIWIVDPQAKGIWAVRDGQAVAVPDLITSFVCDDGPVRVDFNEVFSSPGL
jgi:Uma2 family endonuclease